MSILSPIRRPVTPKCAEAWKPPLSLIAGNYAAMKEARGRVMKNRPEDGANFLLVGEQGTGPSVTLLALIRELLRDPAFGTSNDPDWSLKTGQIYRGMRILGASINKPHLENEVELATHGWGSRHTLVLLNDLDAAFERGLDKALLNMLGHPGVTTYATASSLRDLRLPGVTQQESDRRLRDLLFQFKVRRQTENPDADELHRFLTDRLAEWDIGLDHDNTLRLLVRKSGCVVGYALGALIEALGQDDPPRLTFDLVSGYDPDPLKY